MSEVNALRISGVGVHSGAKGMLRLSLRPREDPCMGPRLLFPGFPALDFPAVSRLPRRAERATILVGKGRADGDITIRTPEHLLAALLFFADCPIDAACDISELPNLDGSALGFRNLLSRLAPGCARTPAWREYDTGLDWEYAWSYGHIRVRPAARFRVSYILDRAPLHQAFTLEDPLAAWREILPARTYVFHREWREVLTMGLMAGAGADSGLLLAESESEHAALLDLHRDWRGGPFPLLNQPSWRMTDEPVKHKILDLLGDLALAGLALPRLDIEIRNGGHSIHHLLLDKLSLN